MIDRMAAVRAEMMDARRVALKVDMTGMLIDYSEVEAMVCVMVGK
jgi:hypothetical protein